MKKLIYGSLFLALVGIGFAGCRKEKIIETHSSQEITTNQKTKSVVFNTINYKSIGQKHNQYMIEAFNNFEESGKTGKDLFLTLDFGVEKKYQSDYYEDMHSMSNDERHNFVKGKLSNKFSKEMIDELRNILLTTENYNVLVREMDSKIQDIQSNCLGLDYGVLMTYIEVSKHSAYLWYTPENGGSGEGVKYFNSVSPLEKARDKPMTTVEKDVLGGAYGMVGWAILGGASLGPWGALGGMIGGTVFGAVTGSIT